MIDRNTRLDQGGCGLIIFVGIYASVLLGGLYLLVRFIHWAWTN